MNLRPKVAGAVGGSTFGGAIATLIVYVLGLNHIVVTPEAAAALAVLCGAIVAWIAGYFTPSNYVLPDTTSVTTTVVTPPKASTP